MAKYNYIAYKILFLCILMVCFNYLYRYAYYEQDRQTHAPEINQVRKVVADKAEVVYIGESSNNTFKSHDIDKRAISDFIADYFPGLTVGAITKPASHAGIYYELLRNIPEQSSVKTVVVTLNLRSFDANWIYSPLETPLQKGLVLLKDRPPLLNRIMLAFRGYEVKTDAEREQQVKAQWKHDKLIFPEPFLYNDVMEWDNGMATLGIKKTDGSINYPLTELACHYIKAYGFQIDTLRNPRIQDFDRIVQLAKARNWNLILNLMAENVELADSLVGKALIYLMKQNRDILVNRYHRNGVQVVDNLTRVKDPEFIDRNWTTEHYAENGRKIIAANVARTLKTLYPNAYVPVTYNTSKAAHFFNNAEGQLPWGQMQTLTDERSYSGKKSSKTWYKQEYSMAFEYAVSHFTDSMQKMTVRMNVFQQNNNHDAKLMFVLIDKEGKQESAEVRIKDLTNTVGAWSAVSHTFTLPKQFYNGDLVKVFVHNPYRTAIYLDDMDILLTR